MENGTNQGFDKNVFLSKSLIVAGVFIPIILLLLFLGFAFQVLLLVMAGVLIAIFFRGIASFLQKKLKLPMKWALVLSITSVLALIVLGGVLMAPSISKQAQQLSQQIPKSLENLKQMTEGNKFAQQLFEDSGSIKKKISQNQGKWAKKAFGALSTTFGVLADLYVIFFIGIFFTVSPRPFANGIVSLFPQENRNRARDVLDDLGKSLKKWLVGKLLSMAVVAVLTIIGLSVMGLPMAIILGIIAGLLSFIPNFGPIIAMIPALLIALSQSENMALYVALLYVGVQAVESNLITPFIQKNMVSIPMALVLIAQVVLGVFSSGLGLILATPIAVMLIVLVKRIYVEDVLGDKMERSKN